MSPSPAILAELEFLANAYEAARAVGWTRAMPDISPSLLSFIAAQPLSGWWAGSGDGGSDDFIYGPTPMRGYGNLTQWASWPSAGGYGDSDGGYIVDPARVDWSVSYLQFGPVSDDSNHAAMYSPTGRFAYYEVMEDNNSWRDIIIAVVMIVGGYYGGTWLSEYGTAAGAGGAGGAEAVSGMDLAADAGMSSVNSAGGTTWGGSYTSTGTSMFENWSSDVALDDYGTSFDFGGDASGSLDVGNSSGYDMFQPDYQPNVSIDDYGTSFDYGSAGGGAGGTGGAGGVSTSPASASSGEWWSVKDITGATREVLSTVMVAAQVVKAFNGEVTPASNTRVVNPNAGTVNGARPPVGVMTLGTDGSAIINNGDGTYTIIRPDGSRITRPYGTSTQLPMGIDPKLLMYGLAGLGAVMLMQRR